MRYLTSYFVSIPFDWGGCTDLWSPTWSPTWHKSNFSTVWKVVSNHSASEFEELTLRWLAQEICDLLHDLFSLPFTTVWDEAHSHETVNLRFDIPARFPFYFRDQIIWISKKLCQVFPIFPHISHIIPYCWRVWRTYKWLKYLKSVQ